MLLTPEEQAMLDGIHGPATRKAMQILVVLGTVYGAEKLLPATSVQIAGVSYDNLGESGLAFLSEMAAGGGRARVLTTLNPAGMDVENWQVLGISPEFAEKQKRVLEVFERMGAKSTCTCTPYLAGNLPHYGEHIAWAESSAVCYANSALGARTNREGGPSALAAALIGRTPAYGLHLDENRRPTVTVEVKARLPELGDWGSSMAFSALGKTIGQALEARRQAAVPYIQGVERASLESLKALCASLATYGGTAMFHMPGVTPEAALHAPPRERVVISQDDLETAVTSLNATALEEVDFVSLGCPHLTIREIARIAELLEHRQVVKEFWITAARPVKRMADRMGYTCTIETAGAKFATDTCCVVAPIRDRFNALATDSAKACYYASAKHAFKTAFLPFEQVVASALGDEIPKSSYDSG